MAREDLAKSGTHVHRAALPGDVDLAVGHVDMRPLEAEGFAETKTSSGRCEEQREMPGLTRPDRRQEPRALRRSKALMLRARSPAGAVRRMARLYPRIEAGLLVMIPSSTASASMAWMIRTEFRDSPPSTFRATSALMID